MGRNRTPSAVLEAKGAFIQNPQRSRPNEPTGNQPLGRAPDFLKLTEQEKELWDVLASKLLPGVAYESDEMMFGMLVILSNKVIEREELPSADKALLSSLSSRFAMTPADRSKVQVEQPKESSLSKFISRRPNVVPTEDLPSQVN